MGRSNRTGILLGIEQLIKSDLIALKPKEYMSLSGFMSHYGFNSSRIVPIFYKLEQEGFMQSNNIEIAYYHPKKNLTSKIYIKK